MSQGRALQSLSLTGIWRGAVTDQEQRFPHQRGASEQRARTALPERNRQQSKHRFQGFCQEKLHFKTFLWINLCFSFMLEKMLLMSFLTCFQQCTIFACPVGNRKASKYRKSKDKDVSGGVHICVLHREIVYITFTITQICALLLCS